jgi:hypothetical protein
MKNFSDEHYVNAYSNFISKFECAVARIRSSNKQVVDVYSRHMYKISNHKMMMPDGKITVVGINYPNNCYFIPNVLRDGDIMHPIILMAEGVCARLRDPSADLESRFGFNYGTLQECFLQGFINRSNYTDQWHSNHWSESAGFHIGRYCLDKHLGVKLKYNIPHILKGIIKA